MGFFQGIKLVMGHGPYAKLVMVFLFTSLGFMVRARAFFHCELSRCVNESKLALLHSLACVLLSRVVRVCVCVCYSRI